VGEWSVGDVRAWVLGGGSQGSSEGSPPGSDGGDGGDGGDGRDGGNSGGGAGAGGADAGDAAGAASDAPSSTASGGDRPPLQAPRGRSTGLSRDLAGQGLGLSSLPVGQRHFYAELLSLARVDGAALPRLTVADVKGLGVPLGDAYRLVGDIEALGRQIARREAEQQQEDVDGFEEGAWGDEEDATPSGGGGGGADDEAGPPPVQKRKPLVVGTAGGTSDYDDERGTEMVPLMTASCLDLA
jgi:hypothetical protein